MEIKYLYSDIELFGTIICLASAGYLYFGRSIIKKEYNALAAFELTSGIMLLSDAFAWFYRGVSGNAAFVIVTVANFLTFLANALLPVFCIIYASYSAKDDERRAINIVIAIALVDITLIIVSQFTHYIYYIDPTTNLYERGAGFALVSSFAMLELVICLIYIIGNRNNIEKGRFLALMSFFGLGLIAGIAQIFVYGYSLTDIAVIVCCILMLIQLLDDNFKTIFSQEIRIYKQDNEMERLRTKIALSQIRPQFIYNTLGTIEKLCDTDTVKAKEICRNLSDYMMQNLESIGTETLIPFEKELDHTKVFLKLEKMRFEGRFDLNIETETMDFEMPALTLQPLVENALTHGIYELPEGEKGRVDITTSVGDGYIKVEVKDNGVGFDSQKISREERHASETAGIKNVRERLKVMEDAELHIRSKEGEGTTADIIIPKR